MSAFTFKRGVNLGGWIAQYFNCADLSAHFETFITEKDIAQMAVWGVDHVRLPFEYGVMTDNSLDYMDRCVSWCEKRGMGVILDLHYVLGQTFNGIDEINPLFIEGNAQPFLDVWDKVASHFKHTGGNVAFELLNEADDKTGYLWNRFFPKGIKAIRRHCPTHKIYVGSNKMNSVFHLNALPIVDDPNIVYNFHYYEPHPFTHQKASFDQEMMAFNRTIAYPGEFAGLEAFLKEHPLYAEKNGYLAFWQNDLRLMKHNLLDAERFVNYTGKPLYCGEFGVIERADEDSAAGWVHDFVLEMRRMDIGYAYWNYKLMDFGLVDADSRLRFPKILKALMD